jgi:hypothetical protein
VAVVAGVAGWRGGRQILSFFFVSLWIVFSRILFRMFHVAFFSFIGFSFYVACFWFMFRVSCFMFLVFTFFFALQVLSLYVFRIFMFCVHRLMFYL